jgi:hypothetical protein
MIEAGEDKATERTVPLALELPAAEMVILLPLFTKLTLVPGRKIELISCPWIALKDGAPAAPVAGPL